MLQTLWGITAPTLQTNSQIQLHTNKHRQNTNRKLMCTNRKLMYRDEMGTGSKPPVQHDLQSNKTILIAQNSQ